MSYKESPLVHQHRFHSSILPSNTHTLLITTNDNFPMAAASTQCLHMRGFIRPSSTNLQEAFYLYVLYSSLHTHTISKNFPGSKPFIRCSFLKTYLIWLQIIQVRQVQCQCWYANARRSRHRSGCWLSVLHTHWQRRCSARRPYAEKQPHGRLAGGV